MKDIRIIANCRRGENLFHAWDATQSFYVFTQRGKIGIENAFWQLKKKFPNITLSICHTAYKKEITHYFS